MRYHLRVYHMLNNFFINVYLTILQLLQVLLYLYIIQYYIHTRKHIYVKHIYFILPYHFTCTYLFSNSRPLWSRQNVDLIHSRRWIIMTKHSLLWALFTDKEPEQEPGLHTLPSTTYELNVNTCWLLWATYQCDAVDPDVEGVAGTLQVRLVELVGLGPAEGGVAQSLLHNGMEPRQQEVEPCSLIRCLQVN